MLAVKRELRLVACSAEMTADAKVGLTENQLAVVMAG